jgi:hypothetical protein
MHRTVTIALVAALAAGFSATNATAQARPKERAAERRRAESAHAAAVVAFTTNERDIIARYYAAHPYRAKALPPGIAKNLARGKPLPPGIARRRLPAALVAELPRRTGVEITVFGDRLVLLDAKGVVVDILANVFH